MSTKLSCRYIIIASIITLNFLNQANGINNLKETISLKDLARVENIEVKKILDEGDGGQWVVSLPNGTVINEGGILTEKGYIIEDTRTAWRDQHGLMGKDRDLDSENPVYFNGRLAVISSPGSENWYHWLLQILPRLIILKESSVAYDRIFVHDLKYEWQVTSLKAVLDFLGIAEDKLLVINGDVVAQATVLVVPSVPFIPQKNDSTQLPKWLKDELKSIFLDCSLSLSEFESFDKIYISRTRASSRRISNEKELIEELEKLGVKAIYLESLSPYDQARLFNNAKAVIGPHGSGFANLIFARPGCQVVEIDHGTNPVRSFYKRMSGLMHCNYHPFYVDKTTEEHLEEDMTVDIEKFREFFNEYASPTLFDF